MYKRQVLNGHTAAVFVKFRKKVTKEQLIQKLREFKGVPQELKLPSAPARFIQYLEEDNRPQVTADVDFERGMGISVGRLRAVSYTHLDVYKRQEERSVNKCYKQ